MSIRLVLASALLLALAACGGGDLPVSHGKHSCGTPKCIQDVIDAQQPGASAPA